MFQKDFFFLFLLSLLINYCAPTEKEATGSTVLNQDSKIVQESPSPSPGHSSELISESNKYPKDTFRPIEKIEQSEPSSEETKLTTDPSPAKEPKVILATKKEPTEKPELTSKVVPPASVLKENLNKIEEVEVPNNLTVAIDIHNHQEWDALTKKFISSSGKVNYQGFKNNLNQLDQYLETLQNNPVQSSWTRNQKMAYWINVYNAFTIKLILDHYPVSSITKLHNGKPWDIKWINIDNTTYSLNQIEHDILRPQFKDARIHFAVNCAAKSCPPILNRAWTPGQLNQDLNQQTRSFINNLKYNTIEEDKIILSKIFEWYQSDFGDLIPYLNKYSNSKISNDVVISFREYDWTLNE